MSKTKRYMKLAVKPALDEKEFLPKDTDTGEDEINYGVRYVSQKMKAKHQLKKIFREEFVACSVEEVRDEEENIRKRMAKIVNQAREVTDEKEIAKFHNQRKPLPYIYEEFIRRIRKQVSGDAEIVYRCGKTIEKGIWRIRIIDGGFNRIDSGLEKESQPQVELWKEILGTKLYNLVPTERFHLFITAYGENRLAVPIYYMECYKQSFQENLEPGTSLQHKENDEQVVVLWEMDQQVDIEFRQHFTRAEIDQMAEYAHSYIKISFDIHLPDHRDFISTKNQNTEKTDSKHVDSQNAGTKSGLEIRPGEIERVWVANLKRSDNEWDAWIEEQAEASSVQAVIAVVLIVLAVIASLISGENIITAIAGVIVADIASEEWISPLAVIFGAIGRFLNNESLAIHMYYKFSLSAGPSGLTITLLSSVGELTVLLGDGEIPNTIVIVSNAINVFCLLPAAIAYFYEGIYAKDMPRIQPAFQPKIFLKGVTGIDRSNVFLRNYLSYCTWNKIRVGDKLKIIRLTLHWTQGGIDPSDSKSVADRFRPRRSTKVEPNLSEEDAIIDLAAPGSPSSLACFSLCLPVFSVYYHNLIMKGAYFGSGFQDKIQSTLLLPAAFFEILLVLLGAIVTIICDVIDSIPRIIYFFVWIVAFSILGLAGVFVKNCKSLQESTKPVLSYRWFPFAPTYLPADLLLLLFVAYTNFMCRTLNLYRMTCRAKSTARLYRIPSLKRVRTGNASNHCWEGANYYEDDYYVMVDTVVINPRWPHMGLVGSGKKVNARKKVLWPSQGRFYKSPCLCY